MSLIKTTSDERKLSPLEALAQTCNNIGKDLPKRFTLNSKKRPKSPVSSNSSTSSLKIQSNRNDSRTRPYPQISPSSLSNSSSTSSSSSNLSPQQSPPPIMPFNSSAFQKYFNNSTAPITSSTKCTDPYCTQCPPQVAQSNNYWLNSISNYSNEQIKAFATNELLADFKRYCQIRSLLLRTNNLRPNETTQLLYPLLSSNGI
jgi:hypothetical protein